jgi:uncharacterized protein (TIGR01777 family)
MHILITGGTGFIGQALVPQLETQGHKLTIYSRQTHPNTTAVAFIQTLAELTQVDPIDVVINLAGESLARNRWTKNYKHTLRASRIDLTQDLIDILQRSHHRPKHFISGSAIGWYGDCGEQKIDENHPAGSGFGAELCKGWETAALAAEETLGSTVTTMRIGVVLDKDGGAFPQLYMPFRFGVANWPGTGDQYLSWIHRSDLVKAIGELVQRPIAGPVNLTAPEPVTYRMLAQEISELRKTWVTMPAPGFAMRLALGEMAEELLLSGQRVLPTKLLSTGFEFEYPTVDRALQALLNS